MDLSKESGTILECITSAYFLLANTSYATLTNVKMAGECNLCALGGKDQKIAIAYPQKKSSSKHRSIKLN